MEPNVPQPPPERGEPLSRPAGQLTPGDVIAKEFLGYAMNEGEVLFTYRYSVGVQRWVLVVALASGVPSAEYWLAEARIPLAREASDPDHGQTTAVAEAKPGEFVECGWQTPSGPCHLGMNHPLFPFGPRDDSGHISAAAAEANRARLAAREGGPQ